MTNIQSNAFLESLGDDWVAVDRLSGVPVARAATEEDVRRARPGEGYDYLQQGDIDGSKAAKAEAEKMKADKAAADKAEADRLAAEQAEADKAEAEAASRPTATDKNKPRR